MKTLVTKSMAFDKEFGTELTTMKIWEYGMKF